MHSRKATLEGLISGAAQGIRFNEHITGDGAMIFECACKLGLEEIVSKRRDSRYISGCSLHWINSKNPGGARTDAGSRRGLGSTAQEERITVPHALARLSRS